jgi:glycopeptide antibiotics resistance protein
MTSTGSRAAVVALGAYLALVLAVTMVPVPGGPHELNLVPTEGIRRTYQDKGFAFGTVQVVGNLLMLAPAGALLRFAFPRFRLRDGALAAAALSIGIELVQWQVAIGRAADIDDVWMNTLGAAVGHAVGEGVARRLG